MGGTVQGEARVRGLCLCMFTRASWLAVPPGHAKEVAHASSTSIFSPSPWDLDDTGCCYSVSGSARSVPDNGESVRA